MIVKIKEYEKYKEVKGVFVGGCYLRGEGSRFHAKAHTHPNGWICILSAKRLACKELLLHELAHALTNMGHNDKWRAKVIELGGTIDEVPELNGKGLILRSYHKKLKK